MSVPFTTSGQDMSRTSSYNPRAPVVYAWVGLGHILPDISWARPQYLTDKFVKTRVKYSDLISIVVYIIITARTSEAGYLFYACLYVCVCVFIWVITEKLRTRNWCNVVRICITVSRNITHDTRPLICNMQWLKSKIYCKLIFSHCGCTLLCQHSSCVTPTLATKETILKWIFWKQASVMN